MYKYNLRNTEKIINLDGSYDYKIIDDFGEIEIPFFLFVGAEFVYQTKVFRVIRSSDHGGLCVKIDGGERISKISQKAGTRKPFHEESWNEEEIKSIVLNRLHPHFEIETEVWGTHFSGNKVRIDAIIRPKDANWKNKRPAMGVEFKSSLHWHKSNKRAVADMYAQCLDYSLTNFSNYGYIPVLLCPRFHENFQIENFLFRYRVGYLYFWEEGLTIGMGTHTLWTEKNGMKPMGFKLDLTRKVGVRSKKNIVSTTGDGEMQPFV